MGQENQQDRREMKRSSLLDGKSKKIADFKVLSLLHILDVWKSECINEYRNDMSKNKLLHIFVESWLITKWEHDLSQNKLSHSAES